jgi:hypothetical protein
MGRLFAPLKEIPLPNAPYPSADQAMETLGERLYFHAVGCIRARGRAGVWWTRP